MTAELVHCSEVKRLTEDNIPPRVCQREEKRVARQVNYPDDLYYIHSMVKSLKSGMNLDLDPDIFRDKLTEDIFFIDSVFFRLLTSLKQNSRLIKRQEYLRMLLRALKGYGDFLTDAIEGSIPFSRHLQPLEEKLSAVRAHVQEISQEIREILQSEGGGGEVSSMVSAEEYEFLLHQEEEEESS